MMYETHWRSGIYKGFGNEPLTDLTCLGGGLGEIWFWVNLGLIRNMQLLCFCNQSRFYRKSPIASVATGISNVQSACDHPLGIYHKLRELGPTCQAKCVHDIWWYVIICVQPLIMCLCLPSYRVLWLAVDTLQTSAKYLPWVVGPDQLFMFQ